MTQPEVLDKLLLALRDLAGVKVCITSLIRSQFAGLDESRLREAFKHALETEVILSAQCNKIAEEAMR